MRIGDALIHVARAGALRPHRARRLRRDRQRGRVAFATCCSADGIANALADSQGPGGETSTWGAPTRTRARTGGARSLTPPASRRAAPVRDQGNRVSRRAPIVEAARRRGGLLAGVAVRPRVSAEAVARAACRDRTGSLTHRRWSRAGHRVVRRPVGLLALAVSSGERGGRRAPERLLRLRGLQSRTSQRRRPRGGVVRVALACAAVASSSVFSSPTPAPRGLLCATRRRATDQPGSLVDQGRVGLEARQPVGARASSRRNLSPQWNPASLPGAAPARGLATRRRDRHWHAVGGRLLPPARRRP